MKLRLQNLQRIHKQLIMLSIDFITLLFALWLAFVLRIGEVFPSDYIFESWWLFIVIPIVMLTLFVKLGLYRAVLQYIGIKVITTTFQATTISCLVVGFFMMFFRESDLPRSVLPIFWFIINIFINSSRFLFKGYLYSWDSFVNSRKQTIIYGAGNAGVQLVESLRKSSLYAPIAFIDDDKTKQGTILNFLEVFAFSTIEDLIRQKDAKVLLFAVPSASEKQRTQILKKLSKYPIEVKVLPSMDNIVNGVVSIDNIKHVEVGDILGRTVVAPKKDLLKRNIFGKNILITGAGGSIGSELSRQIMKLSPNKVVLLDNSEFNLYNIHLELVSKGFSIDLIPSLCTVTNYHQLKKIVEINKIDTEGNKISSNAIAAPEINSYTGTSFLTNCPIPDLIVLMPANFAK